METSTTENIKKLSGVFFAPNTNEIFPFVKEAYNSFQFSLDGEKPDNILMRIINKYYDTWKQHEFSKKDNFGRMDGDFNLRWMREEVEKCLTLSRQYDFFCRPSYYGVDEIGKEGSFTKLACTQIEYVKNEISHESNSVFAFGIANDAIKTSDNDPYLTAGGYRGYESDTGEIVYFHCSEEGYIISVKSSLLVDYYNNNFFGVPTGGGTTKYNKGEQVSNRTIHTKSFNLKEICDKHNISFKEMDLKKGLDYYSKYSLK